MQISLKLFLNGFQIAVSAHKPAELKAMFLLASQNFILNHLGFGTNKLSPGKLHPHTLSPVWWCRVYPGCYRIIIWCSAHLAASVRSVLCIFD